MDYTDYGSDRYRIVYGKYDGIQKQAVNRLYGLIDGYVPYVLVVSQADNIEMENLDENIVLIGTSDDNKHIDKLCREGFIDAESRKEGYSIKVFDNPWKPERMIIVLQGADCPGVLYAAHDFDRWYIQHVLQYEGYHYYTRYRPFIDKCLPFAKKSAPRIEYRGLWTWGHVVYDYRGYIQNMSKCKLNSLILWNDFAPVNAREIVEYAHANAVKIIWGFTWCWGNTDIDPHSKNDLAKWTECVLNTYETQYKDLNGDGIYFQIFTETSDTANNGKSMAELSADWVNAISRAVYEKYPDLWIQFGLHASSIKENAGMMASVDMRMSIVWEDAGGFPYDYDPRKLGSFQETYDYTKQLLSLRGENERFGAVFKGFTILNWPKFEHQKGAFILGERNSRFIDELRREKEFYWRYAAPYWLGQSGELASLIQLIAEAPVKDRILAGLVDDGLWECGAHISMELLAELFWDPWADIKEITTRLFHSGSDV